MISKVWLRLLMCFAICVGAVALTPTLLATVIYDSHISHATCGFDGTKTQPTSKASKNCYEFACSDVLFATSSKFPAAEGGQIAFNITRTGDGIITIAHPENADAFIMGQVSGGNLNILNVNVPGAMTGQGISTQLYQALVNQAGGIQSITGELSGANKAIMQAYISEWYSAQAAASMTPAAAARTSAGFGAQSFDPATEILTSTRNP